MLCNSLNNLASSSAPAHTPGIAPYEGIIITSIICFTILMLALIIKCLLIKLNEQKQACSKPAKTDSKDKYLQQKFALMDRLLSFEESLAKNGSQNEVQEAKYRETINTFINGVSTPAVDSTSKTPTE